MDAIYDESPELSKGKWNNMIGASQYQVFY